MKPMIYARRNVDMRDDPRCFRAGRAMATHEWCTLWSRAKELDGVVEAAALRAAWVGERQALLDMAKLVEVGLAVVCPEGWRLVDYAGENETREDIAARRADQRERKARFDSRRRGNALPPEPRNAEVTRYSNVPNATDPEPYPEPKPDRRSPPPPTGGDAPSVGRVDDPAGMLVGRWTMGIRSVTDRPVSRLSPSDTRALHAAAEAHAAGLRGEALLAWAEAEGAEFARSCDAKFGGFSARRFATWLDAGKPKDGPPVAKVGADGLVHPRARDGRPLQPYDPSAPYMRPVARGRVERATNEDAAEILAAMPLRNQGAAE